MKCILTFNVQGISPYDGKLYFVKGIPDDELDKEEIIEVPAETDLGRMVEANQAMVYDSDTSNDELYNGLDHKSDHDGGSGASELEDQLHPPK